MANIETKVEELLSPIISNLGYELYDVIYEKEGKDFYLRIIIDNSKKDIGILDCEKVNNAINDILDEKDYIKNQYFLEVSSPGIERLLRKEKHFLAQIGNEVCVNCFKKINNKREWQGILKEYNKDEITLETENEAIKINMKDINSVKTVFNF